MTIAEVREKCKSFITGMPRDVFIVAILILASSLSFGLGYLAGLDAGEATTISLTDPPTFSPIQEGKVIEEKVVASKNGTKYYFVGCTGASRIAKENQVWFATDRSAISAGYTLATNCKSP